MSFFRIFLVFSLGILLGSSCSPDLTTEETDTTTVVATVDTFMADRPTFMVEYTPVAPTIDGLLADGCWLEEAWLPIDQRWLGEPFEASDFSGRYQLAWDSVYLYLIAEIVDDTLIDIHPDPLVQYWDDDCLEIFIDADRSGGEHQYSHQAFAYHIALDGNVVDYGPDSTAQLFNDHVLNARHCTGDTCIWEVAIAIYPEDFMEQETPTPQLLPANEVLGFALAYCDNDSSPERENFIGNVPVYGADKNRGYIDAGVFGAVRLVVNGEE